MMENEKIKIAKEKNRKIFPIYKMFAWDLLFYYSISFLFLVQVKGLTASNIFLLDGFYTICKIVSQPFAPILINAIGKRKSTILGNLLVTISVLCVILVEGSIVNLIIAYGIMAFGYLLKGVCESFMLEDSIEDGEGKNSEFSKIDSKGSVYYYIFGAVSAVTTGFLFVINPYVPMYLCFIICIIATLISLKFEHYEVKEEKAKDEYPLKTIIKRIDVTRQEYAFILKSKRLHGLLLFSMLFSGALYIRSTITSSILVDIKIPDQYFGVISAVFTIFAAIGTCTQHFIHKKLRNKVLTAFSITYAMTFILIGIIAILQLNHIFTISIILVLLAIPNMIKGPYYTLIKRYYNSFSNEDISVRIYSAKVLAEDLGSTIIAFVASILLDHMTISYATLIIGILMLIIFIALLDYMKTRVGLDPKEYRKEDIDFKLKEYDEKSVVEIKVGLNENGTTNIEVH